MNVGIDLGTTYSLVSRLDYDGRPVLMPDQSEQDVFHTPSVVCVASPIAFVGRMVEQLLEQQPTLSAIRFFKRQFGETDPIFFDEQGTPWFPETVAALVLKKLRFDAESFATSPVEAAVITVPAHFNDPQRKAVLSAAMMADLPVLGLVEEPVAAALHYGVATSSRDQILVVFDWGGGTFDATVLSLDARGVYVLAKAGLTELGGKEIDEKVGEMVLTQFEGALGAPLTLTARVLLELRRVSEELKIELSAPGRTRVRRPVLLGGQAVEVDISRQSLERAIAALIDQTEEVTLACIKDAGLTPSDAHAILLVGGTSMLPAVEARMRRLFTHDGQRVLYHEPTKAVAFGAAMHAVQLNGEASRYQVPPEFKGVSGLSVGVRTVNPQTGRIMIDTLIKRNMTLPVKVVKTYYTARPNQERIVLELVQYGDSGGEVISLGQLIVGPLPSPRQNYPIEVTVENREDGTVSVQAYDAQTGVELAQVFGRESEGGFAHLATQRALIRSTVINNL
jgi:molecular chaperone DnaK (HSP70)